MRSAYLLASLTFVLATGARADTHAPKNDADLTKLGIDSTREAVTAIIKDAKGAAMYVQSWSGYTTKESFVWDGGAYGLGAESDGATAPCVKIGQRGTVKNGDAAKAEPILRCFGSAIGAADGFTWTIIAAKDLPKQLGGVKARVTSLLKSSTTGTPHVFVLGTRASTGSVGKEYVLAGWDVQHGWAHWALTTLAFASDPVLD
jgi:hypothetical protein